MAASLPLLLLLILAVRYIGAAQGNQNPNQPMKQEQNQAVLLVPLMLASRMTTSLSNEELEDAGEKQGAGIGPWEISGTGSNAVLSWYVGVPMPPSPKPSTPSSPSPPKAPSASPSSTPKAPSPSTPPKGSSASSSAPKAPSPSPASPPKPPTSPSAPKAPAPKAAPSAPSSIGPIRPSKMDPLL